MRNFRNAAIAGATAVALTFGGTTVATAAEENQDTTATGSQENGNSGSSEGRSWQTAVGGSLGNGHGDSEVNGRDLWGKKRNPEKNPEIAETLRGLSIALSVFAGLTFLIAPAYNFLKFGPFAK